MRLKVKTSICSICNLCSLTCAYRRSGTLSLNEAAIRVSHNFFNGLKVKVSHCIQCPQGYCIENCPKQALARQEDGRVILDASLCDTCQGEYKCVEACKYHAMFKGTEGSVPIKCDLCGGDPECVKVCPLEAISVS